MRLALIGPTYPYRGGITHHTTLLARALRTAGHDLLFVSFSRQYPRLLYGRSDRDPSQSPLTEPAEFWLDSLNPLSWLNTARKIKQWQPERVIMPWWVPFWSPAWGTISRSLKRGDNAPHLLFLCHNVLPHERSWLDVTAVRWALNAGDSFVVHAQSEADTLHHLFPQRPVTITPMPTYADVSHTAVSPPPLATIPTDRPLILFCGFVRHYKGLDLLLEATAQVLRSRPVHLAVVGEFWEDTAVYEPALTQLGQNVTVVNAYLPNEELAAYLQRANVVVLPYREATQSAVLQLAFGAGVPVITTTVGGLPEAVTPEQTGLLVPPNDPDALAQAIERYFAEGLETKMRPYVAQGAHQKFGWEALVNVSLTA